MAEESEPSHRARWTLIVVLRCIGRVIIVGRLLLLFAHHRRKASAATNSTEPSSAAATDCQNQADQTDPPGPIQVAFLEAASNSQRVHPGAHIKEILELDDPIYQMPDPTA